MEQWELVAWIIAIVMLAMGVIIMVYVLGGKGEGAIAYLQNIFKGFGGNG